MQLIALAGRRRRGKGRESGPVGGAAVISCVVVTVFLSGCAHCQRPQGPAKQLFSHREPTVEKVPSSTTSSSHRLFFSLTGASPGFLWAWACNVDLAHLVVRPSVPPSLARGRCVLISRPRRGQRSPALLHSAREPLPANPARVWRRHGRAVLASQSAAPVQQRHSSGNMPEIPYSPAPAQNLPTAAWGLADLGAWDHAAASLVDLQQPAPIIREGILRVDR